MAKSVDSPLGKRSRLSKKSAKGKKSNANKNARKKGAIIPLPNHNNNAKPKTLKRESDNFTINGNLIDCMVLLLIFFVWVEVRFYPLIKSD
jgi:hypothetical protein